MNKFFKLRYSENEPAVVFQKLNLALVDPLSSPVRIMIFTWMCGVFGGWVLGLPLTLATFCIWGKSPKRRMPKLCLFHFQGECVCIKNRSVVDYYCLLKINRRSGSKVLIFSFLFLGVVLFVCLKVK